MAATRTTEIMERIGKAFQSRRDQVWLFFVAAGIAFTMGTLLPLPTRVPNFPETLNAASSLALTGTLADPFRAGPTGPTAHVAPVFPAIAALLFLLPVPWPTSLFALAIVLAGLNAALLPKVSQSLFHDRRPGFYAGMLSAFCMPFIPQQDLLLSSFLCIWGCILILDRSTRSWIICGGACLCNPVSIIPLLIIAARTGKRMLLTTLAGAALICLPWIARNYRELGGFIPVRDGFGLELAVSNNDCAAASLKENLLSGCLAQVHPDVSQAEIVRLHRYGERSYNQLRFREGMAWISGHPRRFAWLTFQRAKDYLFPSLQEGPWSIFIWPVTALVLLGIAFRAIPSFGPLQLCALGLWAPYVFIQSDIRYRALGLWAWLLLAGLVIHSFHHRGAGRMRE